MKKRLLLLAGILALGATTFAAEGTRDFLDTFKDAVAPNENISGYWYQDFTGYGDQEGKDDRQMRLQNQIGINVTDNLSFALRTRTYINFPGKDQSNTDNYRADVNYTNGPIFGSKLILSQRGRLYKTGTSEGTYSYRPALDFGGYLGESGWGEASLEFTHTRYTAERDIKDTDGNVIDKNSKDIQRLLYDIDFGWDLGYGFSNEIEFFGGKNVNTGDTDLHSLFLALYFDHTLWTSVNESTKLDFHTEISSTPIKVNSDKITDSKTKFETFDSETFLKLSKTFTPNFNTFVQAGVVTNRDITVHSEHGLNAYGYGRLGFTYSF